MATPRTDPPAAPPAAKPPPPSARGAIARWIFAKVHLEAGVVPRLRELEGQGSVLYVLRDRSPADAAFVRQTLAREGLTPPEVVDLGPSVFRTVGLRFRAFLERRLGWASRESDLERLVRLVAARTPTLVFLRARGRGLDTALRPRRAGAAGRLGVEALCEVLGARLDETVDLVAVPLAPVGSRGFRLREATPNPFLDGVRDAPDELTKWLGYVVGREELSLKVGEGVRLREFREAGAAAAPVGRVAARAARALGEFCEREQRVVLGPPLHPKWAVRDLVLRRPAVRAAVAEAARARRVPVEKVWREARSQFDEIAANFKGLYFWILKLAFFPVWNRMFRGLEITGLEEVAEHVRDRSVVLVPCHRSHFDYLILTYVFHQNFLSVPHIAAGENLSFFPLGMLFRGAGAFFLRRTFGDDGLYKRVFGEYLAYLIGAGYTIEFFIEGGRSRTGKILTPRLGMLGMVVDAKVRGLPRDVSLVPVSIQYERLVEENVYKAELLGAEKERESVGALLRARSVLRRNYGVVHVSFARPISLAEALGEDVERFREHPDDPDVVAARRRFHLKLGFRLLAEVNAAAALGGPNVGATVLLSSPHPGLRQEAFVEGATALVGYAEAAGARRLPSLDRDRESFAETLGFLESQKFVSRLAAEEGRVVLRVDDESRINLDFYKNGSIHVFVLLSIVADGRRRGLTGEALVTEAAWWLDLFRNEFVIPEREHLAARVEEVLARIDQGPVGPDGERSLIVWGAPILRNFREAYGVAASVLGEIPEQGWAQPDAIARMQGRHRAGRWLGELEKPEGATTVTLRNAIDRFVERGVLVLERRGKSGRDRWILPGPRYDQLPEVAARVRAALDLPPNP